MRQSDMDRAHNDGVIPYMHIKATMTILKTFAIFSCLVLDSSAYSTSSKSGVIDQQTSRRNLLKSAVAATAALTFSGGNAAVADEELTDVYFGVGCFWHIQHEFVDAERKLLGRGDHDLTSRAGYAGGTKTGSEGRVCYHNFQSIADYGKLGHGEVVGMKLPETSIGDFAKVYFSLFSPKGGKLFLNDCCRVILRVMQVADMWHVSCIIL